MTQANTPITKDMILTGSAAQSSTRTSYTYSKLLLESAEHNLVLAQFAEKSDLPKHAGTTTIRFFRRGMAKADDVKEITEGVPMNQYSSTELTHIDVKLREFGDATKISQTRVDTDIYDQLKMEVKRMGESAALHFDQLIRDELVRGTKDVISQNVGASGAIGTKKGLLSIDDILAARSRLKINLTPKYEAEGGHYVLVVSHEGAHDLLRDPQWQRVREFQDKQKIYKGELGYHMGIRIVECSNPYREAEGKQGELVKDGNMFTAFLLGREAFAAPKLEGTKSPLAPQFIYNDQPDKSDILNTYIAAGWKAMYAAAVLNPMNIVTIRHKSSLIG